MNRRQFVAGIAAAPLAPAAAVAVPAAAPNVLLRRAAARPVVIASANGHRYKNGGPLTCVEKAWEQMMRPGADLLDALIAGVNIVELDPLDDSVGYGGLPNADGVVQLDSSVMHGPKKRAGAVACLEGVRTPSLVARAVMENTDHHLLVGRDAQTFARNLGFPVEADLNTPNSRGLWLEWKRRTDPLHYPDPAKRAEAGLQVALQMAAEGKIDPGHVYGTINCDGVNPAGDVCGVTTTSGLAFKIPGRVGDSPILGAGLYVDNAVGAAGSTGRGEANLYSLASFLIVEEMRRGAHPKDAGMAAIQRIAANTVEKRLLDDRGRPNFRLNFYAVDKAGRYAGVCLSGDASYAVCTEDGPKLLKSEPLFPS